MQQQRTYDRIAQAIAYIQQNFQQQPQLDEVAAHIHLSPAHFQRLFTDWVGTSPKKFLQYTSVEYAKNILKQQGSVLDATFETGLSSTSRLHDLFIQIEGMTPAEYKQSKEKVELYLQHGSLLVMKDTTQSHWLHRLPPTKKVSTARINLTFRTIVE